LRGDGKKSDEPRNELKDIYSSYILILLSAVITSFFCSLQFLKFSLKRLVP